MAKADDDRDGARTGMPARALTGVLRGLRRGIGLLIGVTAGTVALVAGLLILDLLFFGGRDRQE